MEVADVSVPELTEFLAVDVGDQEATIMTTAERLREEGRMEGRVEGRLEGRVAALLKFLRLRFGDVEPGVESKVRSSTSTEELDQWIERVVTASSIDEVLGSV